MKKLACFLSLVAVVIAAGFAVAAGRDGNRDSVRQAWAAVVVDQNKAAAAERDFAEKAKVVLTAPKAKGRKYSK